MPSSLRLLASSTLVLAGSVIGTSAFADDVTGLYTAVDPRDGGINYLSVSPMDDGTYRIMVSDEIWSDCDPTSRGMLIASGTVSDGVLTREGAEVTCFGSGTVRSLPDNQYNIHSNGRDLTLNHHDGERVYYYHRVSD